MGQIVAEAVATERAESRERSRTRRHRPNGGLLMTDNVLWDGEVVQGFVKPPQRETEETRAIARYNERLNAHPQLLRSTIPLHDGVAVAVKRP